MTIRAKTTTFAAVGALALAAVLAATILFLRYHRSAFVTAPPAAPAGTASTTADQEGIDNDLSLAPAPSGTPATDRPPAVLPKGCVPRLDFQATDDSHYVLTAKNIGGSECRGVSVSVYYADGESFASSGPSPSADGYYWRIGTLGAGKDFVIALATQRSGESQSAAASQACLSADNGADACSNAAKAGDATVVAGGPETPIPATSPALAPQRGKELGAWVWTPVTEMAPARMQAIVNDAAANGLNVLYLTIDDYLGVPASGRTAYEQSLGAFLALAQAKGIAVDAEAGWRDWGEPENRSKATDILQFVAEYNLTHLIPFRGVQYDIEPYLLPGYEDDKAGVLTRYIELVAQLAANDKRYGVPLGMVIPHFYDSAQQWTPQVTVDGVTAFPYDHILRLLGQLPGSRAIVMAYRNFAAGADGTIALAAAEVKGADATGVTVIVAQETGPVTPAYVTFHGSSRASLAAAVAAVNGAFDADRSFGGIGIDYLDTFLDLQ